MLLIFFFWRGSQGIYEDIRRCISAFKDKYAGGICNSLRNFWGFLFFSREDWATIFKILPEEMFVGKPAKIKKKFWRNPFKNTWKKWKKIFEKILGTAKPSESIHRRISWKLKKSMFWNNFWRNCWEYQKLLRVRTGKIAERIPEERSK